MRRRRWWLILLLVLGLTGCGNYRAIEQRDLILVMGIGPAPHGQVTAYFQIPTPQSLIDLTGGSAPKGPTSFVLSGTGQTVEEAFTAAQSSTSRDLYLGQVQLVLFSTKLSSAQFRHAVEFLTREGSLDKTAYVAATGQPLGTMLKFQPDDTRFTGLFFTTMFSCHSCQEVDLDRTIWKLEQQSITPGTSVWMPLVAINAGNTSYAVNSVAVYSGDRPKMTLNAPDSVLLGLLMGRTAKAALSVEGPWGLAGLRSLRARPKISDTYQNGHLTVQAKLALTETLSTLPIGKAGPNTLRQIGDALDQHLANAEVGLLKKLFQAGLDPLGSARGLLWQDPGLASKGPGLYRTAVVHVTVRSTIGDVGDGT